MSVLPVILNPAAGGGSAGRRWPLVAAALEGRGCAFRLYRTTAPGHARALAGELAGSVPRLALVGGDGTVNEVVNGLMDAAAAGTPLPAFGVIPATTGNDFARSLGIPLRPAAAVQSLLSAKPAALDVGRVEFTHAGRPATRHFALACHLGLAAEVADRVNRGSKRWGGTVPFLWHLLRLVATHRGCHLRIEWEGGAWEGSCLAAILANGEWLGGGMRMAPHARMDDGWLDLVAFGALSVPRRLLHLPRIYSGAHVHLREVALVRVRAASLTADRPALLDVDGETIGRLPAKVSLLPGALRVLAPARGPREVDHGLSKVPPR